MTSAFETAYSRIRIYKGAFNLFLISSLLLFGKLTYGQFDNGKFVNCLSQNEEWKKWAPDPKNPEHTPIKIIPLYFHFILDENCENNFHDSTDFPADTYVKDLLHFVNKRLESNVKMTAPVNDNCSSDFISDTRIRVKSVGISTHICDEDCNSYPGASKHGSHPCDCLAKYNVNEEHYINIYFMEDSNPEKRAGGEAYPMESCLSRYRNPNDSIWSRPVTSSTIGIRLEGLWGIWKSKEMGVWQGNNVLMHELGHIIGLLGHPWISNDYMGRPSFDCCDTPRGRGDWKSNNQMDYGMGDRGFTQCQLGLIHKNMYEKYFPYLMDDYCFYQSNETIRIDSNQNITWHTARLLKGDLVIEEGSSLRIKCTLGMPKSAKIIVEDGAQLIIDGGLITNVCDERWVGIEVRNDLKKRKKKEKSPPLLFENGGKIENTQIEIYKIPINRGKVASERQLMRVERRRLRKREK